MHYRFDSIDDNIDPLKIGGFLAFEAFLIALLKDKTKKEQAEIQKIIERLGTFDPGRGDNLAILVLQLTKDVSDIGNKTAEQIAPVIADMQLRIAQATNKHDGRGPLNEIEQARIKLLSMKNVELVKSYYRDTLAVWLGAMMFELLNQGKSKTDTIESMVRYAERSTNHFIFGISPMALNWARNTQLITSYVETGVKQYRIVAVLDARTTQICRFLHGRVFSVQDAIPKMTRIVNARNRDEVIKENAFVTHKDDNFYVNGVKLDLNVSSQVLALYGLGFPPYHWGCRSTVEVVR